MNKPIQEEFWFDMPEFVQEKQAPYLELRVRFADKEALDEFAELLGQKLTVKTKSIWHPELVRGLNGGKRYVE